MNKIGTLSLLHAIIVSAHISSAYWLGTYTNKYFVLIGFYSWFPWLLYLLPKERFKTAIAGVIILLPCLPLAFTFTAWAIGGVAA